MAETTPADLRIGNAERDDTIVLLREHTAAGRLDLDEFEERVGQVTAARTSADLGKVLIDLPAIDRPGGQPAQATYSYDRAPVSPELQYPRDTRSPRRGWTKLPIIALAVLAMVHFGQFWLVWVIVPIALSSFGGCGATRRSGHHQHHQVSA